MVLDWVRLLALGFVSGIIGIWVDNSGAVRWSSIGSGFEQEMAISKMMML